MNKLICFLAIFISACTSQQIIEVPQGMKVATENSVQNCEFKGDVHGVSSLYGYFIETGIARSRAQAFAQAKSLGANTVVWLPLKTNIGSTESSGNAYLCK